jgi:hypothetical protein
MMISVEQPVEWLAGESEVREENLTQCHFVTTNPTWHDPDTKPGRRYGKPATNRLSYDSTALE